MKRYIILLLVILFWNISYANRDSVSTVNYWMTAHNPLIVNVLFDNIKTDDKNPDYFTWDNLFPIASFEIIEWWCEITKNSDNLKITYSRNSTDYDSEYCKWYYTLWSRKICIPKDYHTCKVKIEIDTWDLIDFIDNNLIVSSIWEKQKILDSISYGLNDSFNVDLKITVSWNGGKISDYTSWLWVYSLKYKYSYTNGTWGGGDIPWDVIENKPDCSDWIDNDWDWKTDYWDTDNNDLDCDSSEDTSEVWLYIRNIHTIPTIALDNFQPFSTDVAIDNTDKTVWSNPRIWTIYMLADNKRTTSNLIPIWYTSVITADTTNWIKKVIFTVMDKDWTSKLSDDCVYEGSYSNPIIAGGKIALYINWSCRDIEKVGDYSISFQYIDKDWYPSDEYIFDFKVIPWQVSELTSSMSVSAQNSQMYADAFSKYKYTFIFKDKYNNLIKNRIIWEYIKLISNDIKLDEITNTNKATFIDDKINFNISNSWKLIWNIVSYNDWNENLKLKVKISKVWATIPSSTNSYKTYKKIPWELSFIKEANKTFKDIFVWFDLLTWENNAIFWFGMDIPLKLKITTKNYNSNEQIQNIKLKFNPIVKDKNGNNINVIVTPWTWYENKWNQLKNGTFGINNLSKNSSEESWKFVIRIENDDDDIISDCKLSWNGWIEYTLKWMWWIKIIKKKINWNSNIDIKYWGVYVEWLFSSKVKWLYELLRNSSNNIDMAQSASKIVWLKIKTYNNILKTLAEQIRWIKETELTSIWNLNWVYYKNWDIILDWWEIKGKSLVYANGWNVYIKWNIKKKWGILTIVTKSVNWNWGYIFIDNNVTNIDSILVAEKWIYSSLSSNGWIFDKSSIIDIVKWEKNDELKNQLLIYGMVLSKWNTMWGSVRIWWKYVLPSGKLLDGNRFNFYKSAIYDLNYLRRYHIDFNAWNTACSTNSSNYGTTCSKLDTSKYGTYPVIIKSDTAIKTDKPYGFR